MESEVASLYTKIIYNTKDFIWLLALIGFISFGNYVAAVIVFPPFRNLLTSYPLMGRFKKEFKRATLLLLMYLCVAIIYAFSGSSILFFMADTGDIRSYVISSMILGITVASVTRILAVSGLKSIIVGLYYQIAFTVSALILFWLGPLELSPQSIFNPVHFVLSKMLEEGYMSLIIFLLLLVYFSTESIIRRIKLSRIKILKPINEDN